MFCTFINRIPCWMLQSV